MQMAIAGLIGLFLVTTDALAQPELAAVAEANSTVTYPAAFFTQYAPVSVADMLDRIPGIGLALSTNRGQLRDVAERGLGGSSQILIDGKRLAGKANDANSQLSRIAAAEVDHIEIIRGTSSNLDVQNSGQIVNIVLKQAAIRSSLSAQLGLLHYADNKIEPEGRLSLTGQRGPLNYLIGASSASGYGVDESFELSLHPDLKFNEIVEFERTRELTTNSFNSNLTYDLSSRDRLALNALYVENDPPSYLLRSRTDYNSPTPVVTFEREQVPSTADNWEIGGDYEHGFENGSKYKFLFITNDKQSETTRERWAFKSPGAAETKNLFLNNGSRYREKIIRTSYTFNLNPEQGLESGLEVADTIQDAKLKLGLPLGASSPAHGGLTPVPVPNANSTVEELRLEAFAVHNWRINSRMSLESSLIAEFSEIEQTGDIVNKRDFNFLKPKVDFRFDMNQSTQMRLTAEKVVSQMSFADFSASTNNRDEDQNTLAGNPEIEQEESWRYTLNLDYRLPNDGGVFNSRLFYFDIDQAIGRIDISKSTAVLEASNGNVGRGSVLGLNLDASVRMGFIDMPQVLMTAGLLVQNSAIDDPLIGFERRVVPYDRGQYRIGMRHDVSSRGFNYGINYMHRIDGNRPLWDIDNVLLIGSASDLELFVEKAGFAGLTFRFEAVNILDHVNKQERRRYSGYLRDGALKEIERFSVTNGVRYALKVRGTF